MKNATLSVLLLLTLGLSWVGVAAAQADEPEGDTSSEPSDSTESADEAPAEAPPVEDAAEAAPAEDATEAAGVSAEEAIEGGDPVEAVEAVEAVVEEEPEPEVSQPDPVEVAEAAEAPVEEEPGSDLAAPDAEAEAPAEAAEEPAAAPPEPPPWRNTFFNFSNQVTTNTFWQGGQLSYNPTYQQAYSISPRWYPGTGGFIRGNMGFTLELTDANSGVRNREPLLNDLLLDYVHPFMLGEGFILMTMARVTVPLSRASLAAQRYLQAAGQLTLIKIIPEAGNLTLAVLGRYGHWFAGSNVVQTDTPQPCTTTNVPSANVGGTGVGDIDDTCGQFGSATTGRHVILAGVSATMTPIGAFSINLSAFIFNSYGHDLAAAEINVASSEEPLILQDGSPSHWRNFTYFALSVAYQFLPWLNMSLGIQNSGVVASAYQPNGDLYNPLFTPNTQVFLSATIGLDQLFLEITGGGEEDLTPEERQRRQQGLASGPSVGGSF